MADDLDLPTLTAEIVAAYVSGNKVEVAELTTVIRAVHDALSSAGKPQVEPEPDTRVTPAQIRKSITPDALISLVDGKPYKSLKRHLATQGMTPDEYRAKFGLPRDYPMVAASYSAQRSALAKQLGLGNRRLPAPPPAAEPAKRGRKPRTQPQAQQTQQAQQSHGIDETVV